MKLFRFFLTGLILLVLSCSSISWCQLNEPTPEYLEVRFQHQDFEGKKSLSSFLKKHKKNDAYKSAPCQFQLRCTFYLNENGHVDSISSFKRVKYVTEPIPFWNELEDEIKSQSKSYRFYNQVAYKDSVVNMDSFLMILDFDCDEGWVINKFPEEYKEYRKFNKDVILNYRKD